MSSWWTEGRKAWLELEELAAAGVATDGRCRKCGALALGIALCATCDQARLAGLQRFGGRAGANAPHHSPRRFDTAARPEWTPYKDN